MKEDLIGDLLRAQDDIPPPEPFKRMPEVWLVSYPLYLVAMHRLARLGKADVYSPGTHRFVQFKMANHAKMEETWVDLKDIERVTILYNDPSRKEIIRVL